MRVAVVVRVAVRVAVTVAVAVTWAGEAEAAQNAHDDSVQTQITN